MRNGQRTIDAALAEVAASQHGVVTKDQLRRLGLSDGAIAERVASGRLHRCHPGVFAVGHPGVSRDGRRMAVVLACGPGAALSHTTAAVVWGLRGGGVTHWHVVAPGMSGGRRGPRGATVHRTLDLAPQDVATVAGVPVTSVARTLVDLAGVVRPASLARAIHEAEVQRALDVEAIADVMRRLPRRRGVAALRKLLGSPGDPATIAEAFPVAFLRLCHRHGLPTPRIGVHLPIAERLVECDAVFPAARLVVELDGERFHRTRRSFEGDRRRDAALAAEGYQTVRLTWHRVTHEGPTVAAELKQIIALRTAT